MPPRALAEVDVDPEPVSTTRPRQRGSKLPWPRRDTDGTPLGIDLSKHAADVRHIVCAFFRVPGLDMEDLVQEVYMAIQSRNYSRSAFDPRKHPRGHYGAYVRFIAHNVVKNHLAARKAKSRIPEHLFLDDPNTPLDRALSDQGENTLSQERILDLIADTDLDVCQALVGSRTCGEDATLAWVDLGAGKVFSVCREHEGMAAGRQAMAPAELARALTGLA